MPLPSRSPIQLLPVALLVLGIAVDGVRIEVGGRNPQGARAFAMFATVDFSTTRRVIASVPGDPAVLLDIPEALEDHRSRLAAAPSDARARSFAALLLERSWAVEGTRASVGGGAPFDQVRVQVIGLEADGRTISRRALIDVVVGRSGSW